MKPLLMNKLGEFNYYNNKVNELTEKVNLAKKNLVRDIRSQYSVLSEKIKDVEGKRNEIYPLKHPSYNMIATISKT